MYSATLHNTRMYSEGEIALKLIECILPLCIIHECILNCLNVCRRLLIIFFVGAVSLHKIDSWIKFLHQSWCHHPHEHPHENSAMPMLLWTNSKLFQNSFHNSNSKTHRFLNSITGSSSNALSNLNSSFKFQVQISKDFWIHFRIHTDFKGRSQSHAEQLQRRSRVEGGVSHPGEGSKPGEQNNLLKQIYNK